MKKGIIFDFGNPLATHKYIKPLQLIDLQELSEITLYPRGESNSNQKFRKLLFYPLNYRGNSCLVAIATSAVIF